MELITKTDIDYCVCEKSERGKYPHRLGFVVTIIEHIVVFCVFPVLYILTRQLVILLFIGVWLIIWSGIFLYSYADYFRKGHSNKCSLRHAMLQAIYTSRGV